MKNLALIASIFLAALHSRDALACADNEYEQCWSIGPYRDCKCFPKVPGPIGQAAEGGKKVLGAVISEARKSPQAIAACLQKVDKCVQEILAAPLAIPLHAYMDSLYKQAEGKVVPFSPEFIALAQSHYSVDLRGITSADGINTGHGQTVAYCDRIFFAPASINIWENYNDLRLMLHELEHTVQCQGRGKSAYLAEYILKGALDVVKSGQVNVHDMHDYEVAAEKKANYLAPMIWQQMQASKSIGSSPHSVPTPGQSMAQPRWLTACRTTMGTCPMPMFLGFPGSSCYCQTPYGAIGGVAN